jgi:polyhydroxybutyrate depolymerase
MRKLYILSILFLVTMVSALAQTTISIRVNGVNREYILYIPPGHNGQVPAPLVLNFHGYGSNAVQQQIYANMNIVADTADFIVVYAEGLNSAWNTFGFQTTPDDVAFTTAIIEDVNERVRVDASRVYACGMSNGGYMSHLLACQLEDRIAAIVSVTGILAPGVMATCNPSRPVPVLQIHGTNDATVPYNGGIGIGSVDSTMQFWLAKNNCPTVATVIDTLPNNNNTDNSYPIRYRTLNCDSSTEVTLIKIVNGGHTWPNAPFLIPNLVTNKDIDGSIEAWGFFSKYTHPNPTPLDTATSIRSIQGSNKLVKTYPNPMGNQLTIEITDERVKRVALFDVLGAKIYEANVSSYSIRLQVNTSNLVSGVYLLQVVTATGNTTYKLIK